MGNSESHRQTFSPDECVEAKKLNERSFCITHQGFRKAQEDAWDYTSFTSDYNKTYELFCILDGHGGIETVKYCKSKLLSNLMQCIRFDSREDEEPFSIEESIKNSFVRTEIELTESFTSIGTSPSSFSSSSLESRSAEFDFVAPQKKFFRGHVLNAQAQSFVPREKEGFYEDSPPPPPPKLVYTAKDFTPSASLSNAVSSPLPKSRNNSESLCPDLEYTYDSDSSSVPPPPPPIELKSSLPNVSVSSTTTLPLEIPTTQRPLQVKIPSMPKVWYGDDGSGACALVCVKTKNAIILGNAGDCRALLIFKNRSFETLMTEHKASLPEETRRIVEAGLFVQGERVMGELMISRSIGDFKYKGKKKEIELQAVTCVPETRTIALDDTLHMLLLMSDGIVDGISMEELVDRIFEEGPLEEKLCRIIDFCIQPSRSMDNVTLLAIPLDDSSK